MPEHEQIANHSLLYPLMKLWLEQENMIFIVFLTLFTLIKLSVCPLFIHRSFLAIQFRFLTQETRMLCLGSL
jgi:hypothetical protein